MSRDEAHPALHTPPSPEELEIESGHIHAHFVPEGWEDFDRGICPCGEVVAWNAGAQQWMAVREMRVLVLTQREASAVLDMLDLGKDGDVPATREMVWRQLTLQDEVEEFEAAND